MARSNQAPMAALFLVLFVVSVGFGIIIPILPLIAREYGATGFMLGAMTAGYAVVQFICAPIWGRISDRLGRKPVLMVGIAGLAFSFLFMGFSRSFAGLFAGRVLGGVLGSATLPAAQALAAELSGVSNRAKAMGLMGAAFGTGFIFGPLIGGALARFGVSAPFLTGGGLALATVLLSWAVLREPAPGSGSAQREAPATGARDEQGAFFGNLARAITSPGAPYYGLAFAIMFGQSSLMTALALYLTDRFGVEAAGVGIVFALNGCVGALIQGVAIGRVTERLGEYQTILVGLAFGIAGFVLLCGAPVYWAAVASVLLTGVSVSLSRPSATSLLSQVTPLPQGITMGLQGSFDSLGRVVGPLWAGFAYDRMRILPFISAAAAFLIMYLYLWSRREAQSRALKASQSRAE